MLKKRSIRSIGFLVSAALMTGSPLSFGDFMDESEASIHMRNFYFDRDFKHDDAPDNHPSEWAQGLTLNYESGFTDGLVGFGLDASAMLGIKLHSGGGSTGSGLLPSSSNGNSEDYYSKLNVAAKIRISDSVLKVGQQMPRNPLLQPSDLRLFPTYYQGATVAFDEFDRLKVNAGWLNRDRGRESTDRTKMVPFAVPGRGFTVIDPDEGDRFYYIGADYNATPNLLMSYYTGGLKDYYEQDFAGLVYTYPINSDQYLSADVRYFDTQDDGRRNVTRIDNQAFSARLTYGLGMHTLSGSYQEMRGDTGFVILSNNDHYVHHAVQYGAFVNTGEESWQVRYDYDFSELGVPGLVFMFRYLRGDNIDMGSDAPTGKEYERGTEIAYTFQTGPIKGLNVRLRNASYRSDFAGGTDLDENRLIFNYTWQIL